MTAPFVARTKTDRLKLQDNRPVPHTHPVTLACGCRTAVQPGLSNPDRWFCCREWQAKR